MYLFRSGQSLFEAFFFTTETDASDRAYFPDSFEFVYLIQVAQS